MARRGADFGVQIDHFSIDWQRVRVRVVGIIEDMSRGIESWLRGTAGYFMATGASYKVVMETLPVHPTMAEFLPTILGELKPVGEF